MYSVYIFCGIFLDDISTHGQFAFLVYCYRVEAVFHNLCTVLYWRLCGLTNSPIVKYTLSSEADVHWAQKVLSNNGFRMANCFGCLSQNTMVCLVHCRQTLQQKSWKLQDFFKTETKTKTKCSRPRSRPRLHDPRQSPMTKTFIFVLEAPRDQDLVSRTTSLHLNRH